MKGERHNFELKNYGKIATSRELGRGGFGIVYLGAPRVLLTACRSLSHAQCIMTSEKPATYSVTR